MKKTNITTIVLSLSLIALMASCYSDDSTLADNPISGLTITTDGDETLYTSYLDYLDINPIVNRGTASDTVGLTYRWQITEVAKDQADWIDIGSDLNLHAVMNNPIATTPYYLKLTVTDPQQGGIEVYKMWKVYINSAFLDGILVADTRDNQSSDFSLVMSKDLTLNYKNDEHIYYGILEKANGEPLNGLMSQLTFQMYGRPIFSHRNQVWAVMADGDCVRFDTEDYSQTGRLSEGGIMTYRPEGLKCTNSFIAAMRFFLNTDTNIYQFNTTSANNFGWYDAAASNYKIDNGVVAATTYYDTYYQNAIWYDATKGCFVYASGNIQMQYGTDFAANSYFDPSNMAGYTAIAAGMTTDSKTPAFVMKEKSSGNYAIYTFTRYEEAQGYWDDTWTYWTETKPEVPHSARMRFDIPSEGKQLLDNAVSVFFAADQSILYVATSTGIYTMNFAGTSLTVNTNPVFTPASGEKITKAKLYTQGMYMIEAERVGDPSSGDGIFSELPFNKKAVMIATQKSDYDGNMIVVPMIQLGTGNLDGKNARTYTGFGKILDFCTTAY